MNFILNNAGVPDVPLLNPNLPKNYQVLLKVTEVHYYYIVFIDIDGLHTYLLASSPINRNIDNNYKVVVISGHKFIVKPLTFL